MDEKTAREILEDTRKKLDRAHELILRDALERQREGSSGRVVVEYLWEDGAVKKFMFDRRLTFDENGNSIRNNAT
jgi:hypothetical protein